MRAFQIYDSTFDGFISILDISQFFMNEGQKDQMLEQEIQAISTSYLAIHQQTNFVKKNSTFDFALFDQALLGKPSKIVNLFRDAISRLKAEEGFLDFLKQSK